MLSHEMVNTGYTSSTQYCQCNACEAAVVLCVVGWVQTLPQVRVGDRVYVCSTGSGTIFELSYPSMAMVRHSPRVSQQPRGKALHLCILHM
jgi:hypothetical protein